MEKRTNAEGRWPKLIMIKWVIEKYQGSKIAGATERPTEAIFEKQGLLRYGPSP